MVYVYRYAYIWVGLYNCIYVHTYINLHTRICTYTYVYIHITEFITYFQKPNTIQLRVLLPFPFVTIRETTILPYESAVPRKVLKSSAKHLAK